MNYYNEHDPKTAAWLRELINRKLIPAGIVDERSIVDVQADDLREFTQCHFFAGIGGWSLALQLAGWPEDRPVWTGSCPCQPFSTAGKGLAQQDERHLWPVFFDLIRQCQPPIVFGEQVASAAVVGRFDKNKSVQSVRDRKTLLRILQELKRRTAGNMQGLREDGRANAEAKQAQDGKGRLQKMEGRETRLCSCERGEAQSQEFWDTIRPLGREHSGADRQGGLRSDGDTLRPIDSTLLERALTGSNHTQSGIHHGEYPSGFICPECHGELLGVTEDCGSVEGDSRIEERSIQQIIGLNREETSGTPEECWLDGISADLDGEGYTCGSAVLGAHSVGAPHIRQRLYWGASSGGWKRIVFAGDCDEDGNCPECGIDYADCERLGPTQDGVEYEERDGILFGRWVVNSINEGSQGYLKSRDVELQRVAESNGSTRQAGFSNAWAGSRLHQCRDGKARRIPTEPAFFPLDHGIPARVVRLRGYGNAIVPQVAAEFIKAFCEVASQDQRFVIGSP